MNFIRLVIFCSIALAGPVAWASEEADIGRVKATMHSFLVELAAVKPYLGSPEAFASDKGRKAVGSALDKLASKVRNPPEKLKENVGFRITFGLLADHIQKTKTIFEKGEMEYARVRLAGTPSLCASCHTQTPVAMKSSLFPPTDDLTAKTNFDNANFLFVIRRYEQALAQFDVLIRGYPGSGISDPQLNDLLRRKVAIYARVFRDPKAAVASFKLDLRNSKLPSDTHQIIKTWIQGFEKLGKEKIDPEGLTTAQLLDRVTAQMPKEANRNIPTGDPNLLKLLYLSGLLYERIYSEPNAPRTQELLYYLSVFERSLAPLVWYSVPEVYLRECIVAFPPSSTSKRCLDAYESGMRERFAGRLIPEPIQNSIDALKESLK